jgi:membrane-associated phospholipid phosphatase
MVYLFLFFSRNAAVSWGLMLGLCLACVVVAKILGYLIVLNTGAPIAAVKISGHAAFATLFYISAGIVAGQSRSGRTVLLLYVAGAGLSGAVAVSRLVLTAHTALEITLGTTLGLVFSCLFARCLSSNRRRDAGQGARSGLSPIIWCAIMAAPGLIEFIFGGPRLNTEKIFLSLAKILS